mmetsp:Transcript_40891/g.80570  ORF Transcript_40891/g.80570 Transcript_40891/m.80570 type:complete len:117 (+) Transcript_40891:585-935(+)
MPSCNRGKVIGLCFPMACKRSDALAPPLLSSVILFHFTLPSGLLLPFFLSFFFLRSLPVFLTSSLGSALSTSSSARGTQINNSIKYQPQQINKANINPADQQGKYQQNFATWGDTE